MVSCRQYCRGETQMANNKRARLPAATVNGKRSYYKPAMRSTGWPDPQALIVGGRKVRVAPSQLHGFYVTWLDGKKRQYENVGNDVITAWQAKLNRETIQQGVAFEYSFSDSKGNLPNPLLVAQCHHGIDLHRPPRGHVCRGGCNRRQQEGQESKRRDIGLNYSEECTGERSGQ